MPQTPKTVEEISEKLKLKTVHELKQLARAIGLKMRLNPTRAMLEDDILKLASNEVEPVIGARRGAKPKSDMVDRQLVADIELCRRVLAGATEDIQVSALSEQELNRMKEADSSTICDTHGITYIDDNNFYLHRFGYPTHTDALIGSSVASSYSLEPGFSIQGKGIIGLPNIFGITSIDKVNGYDATMPIPKSKRDFRFMEGTADKPILRSASAYSALATLVNFVAPIFEGGSQLLLTTPTSERFKYVCDLADSVSKNSDVRTIVLLFDTFDGDATRYSARLKGCEVYCILASIPSEKKIEEVEMVLSYVKNLASLENKVVLIADGLSGMLHAGKEQDKSGLLAREVFTSSKKTEVGSLTVVATLTNDEYFISSGFVSEFSLFADSVVSFSSELELKAIEPPIDLAASYIKNYDLITYNHRKAVTSVRTGFDRSGVLGLAKLIRNGANLEQLIDLFKD